MNKCLIILSPGPSPPESADVALESLAVRSVGAAKPVLESSMARRPGKEESWML